MDDIHATGEQRRLDTETIIIRCFALIRRVQAQIDASHTLMGQTEERLQAHGEAKEAPA